ncbi:gliding motility lipoprotein GldB [Mucilaginibacter sp. UYCu711]|uniref:gliding motility lipoprotein GldB n=1 Tax=Mucilaginibacter sp. UYCu711 TaxID=3156339 RepID=UPI003D260E89
MIPSFYKFKQIYLIFIIGVLLTACGRNKKIDVSNIPIDVKIERFDHDFDGLRTKPMEQQAIFMLQKYGGFYRDYTQQILEAGSINDTAYFNTLRNVFKGQAYLDLKHDVDAVYPGNMAKQEAELTDAFRRIKYYYPKKSIPKVYAYFSGFKAQTSVGDGYFGIGLDLFLGADSRFYPALTEVFPRYISRRFTPENIAPRVVEGMAREDMFPESENDKTLLSKMVYNGKILYFMDQILPDVADSVKIGYTTQQIKWCTDFKSTIWAYLLEQNLLYETDDQKIQTYINEAPFTPQLGEHNQSAPKLGVWTGWQIVKEYMDRHPDVTLQQLMNNQDAQKILNDSKYRPK